MFITIIQKYRFMHQNGRQLTHTHEQIQELAFVTNMKKILAILATCTKFTKLIT